MKTEEIKFLFAQFENASAEVEGVECRKVPCIMILAIIRFMI
jgi:hypothetical protein